MKHSLLILLLTPMLLLSSYASAMHHGHGGHDHAKHLEKMQQQLNLTPEQVEQMNALHQEMKACRDKHQQQVKAILTEEQWQKMQQHRQQKKQQHQHRKQQRKGQQDS